MTLPARPSSSGARRFWYASATSWSSPGLFFLLRARTASVIYPSVTLLRCMASLCSSVNTLGNARTILRVVSLSPYWPWFCCLQKLYATSSSTSRLLPVTLPSCSLSALIYCGCPASASSQMYRSDLYGTGLPI